MSNLAEQLRMSQRWVTWVYFMPLIVLWLCVRHGPRTGLTMYRVEERKRRHEEDVAFGIERNDDENPQT